MVKNHFTATGIVFNYKNEILMILHNKLQVWLPPGGHINDNELPEDAVLREVFEETGIKANIISNKRNYTFINKHCVELETPFVVLLEDIEENGMHNHIDMIFICNALNNDFKLQKREIHGIGWFSIEQIKRLKTYDNVFKIIINASEYRNNRIAK